MNPTASPATAIGTRWQSCAAVAAVSSPTSGLRASEQTTPWTLATPALVTRRPDTPHAWARACASPPAVQHPGMLPERRRHARVTLPAAAERVP